MSAIGFLLKRDQPDAVDLCKQLVAALRARGLVKGRHDDGVKVLGDGKLGHRRHRKLGIVAPGRGI